jgi:hypothetical protein
MPTEERRGADFFTESRENAKTFIYRDDRQRFLDAIVKEKLLEGIRKHGSFIIRYRLLIDGTPTYVNMKATLARGDDKHVIIGISNVDSQVNAQKAIERAAQERKLYQRLKTSAAHSPSTRLTARRKAMTWRRSWHPWRAKAEEASISAALMPGAEHATPRPHRRHRPSTAAAVKAGTAGAVEPVPLLS